MEARRKRAALEQTIDEIQAGGGTALYDAIAAAYEEAKARAAKQPGRIHAVVVMTDGKDENSRLKLAALTRQLTDENVKVFTIGYGGSADDTVLGSIAEAAHGASEKGSVENIAAVFEDMGAFL